MGSELERRALRRITDRLNAAGVTLPQDLTASVNRAIFCGDEGSTGARLWTAANPRAAEALEPCCWSSSIDGHDRCTCWVPVFDVDQAPPRRPTRPEDLRPRPRMCGDCAFRPGSPERSTEWMAETLLELPGTGEPFWCHDGMRRPVRWEHPDGRTVDGAPDDWTPPMVGGIPYRADGAPALLCAGWVALATRTEES